MRVRSFSVFTKMRDCAITVLSQLIQFERQVMCLIDYRDSRPIYEQIKEKLRHMILSGALKEGDKLPSVRELAGELAINPNTIMRAYRELESEGFVCTVQGKGCFVNNVCSVDESHKKMLLEKFRHTAQELLLLGVRAEELEIILRKEAERLD